MPAYIVEFVQDARKIAPVSVYAPTPEEAGHRARHLYMDMAHGSPKVSRVHERPVARAPAQAEGSGCG